MQHPFSDFFKILAFKEKVTLVFNVCYYSKIVLYLMVLNHKSKTLPSSYDAVLSLILAFLFLE